MKYIFIIPIILIFLSCSGKNPVEKRNNFKNSNITLNIDSTLPFSKKLTNLLHEYDTSVVLEASYFICKIFKIEYAQKEKIDYCNLYKDLFFKKPHFYLIKLDSIILKNDFFLLQFVIGAKTKNYLVLL